MGSPDLRIPLTTIISRRLPWGSTKWNREWISGCARRTAACDRTSGSWSRATSTAPEQKTRLEEKQRDGRKTRKARKEKESQPKWFESRVHQFTKQDDWFYCGQFWETKHQPPTSPNNIF